MLDSDGTTTLLRMRHEIAGNLVLLAGWRLLLLMKYNPDWHLQPRAPAGDPDGGEWIAWLGAAAGSLLPALQRVARPASEG